MISMSKVENLKQITLSFQAGTSPDTMDLIPKYPQFKFIFALGQEGMSPFEYELVNKTEGEEVLLHINKQTFYTFFEHLNPPIWDLFDGREDIYLNAKIDAVAAADNRDIVKALAEMTAHGGGGCDCGGGCGCGC
jgi:hypothetical protein